MANFVYPYQSGAGYVTMGTPLQGLPESITLDGTKYDVRPEFHCSLVAVKKIIPLLMERDGITEAAAVQKVEGIILSSINATPPTLDGYGELKIADQPDRGRRTVVVMVNATGIGEIFDRLNDELELAVPVQTAHITLYALDGLPIGLTSPDEVKRWTRPLSEIEASDWARQVDGPEIFGATK